MCRGVRRRELSEFTVDMDLFASTHEEPALDFSGREHRRNLAVDDDQCSKGIADNKIGIANAIILVSSDCQVVLHGHRDFICFETHDMCDVLTFNLWNTDTQTVEVADFQSGSHFCKSANDFSFEVVTETCVDKVQFLLTGPNNYAYQHTALLGDLRKVIGQTLEAGAYSLTVKPKRQSNFPLQTLDLLVMIVREMEEEYKQFKCKRCNICMLSAEARDC